MQSEVNYPPNDSGNKTKQILPVFSSHPVSLRFTGRKTVAPPLPGLLLGLVHLCTGVCSNCTLIVRLMYLRSREGVLGPLSHWRERMMCERATREKALKAADKQQGNC